MFSWVWCHFSVIACLKISEMSLLVYVCFFLFLIKLETMVCPVEHNFVVSSFLNKVGNNGECGLCKLCSLSAMWYTNLLKGLGVDSREEEISVCVCVCNIMLFNFIILYWFTFLWVYYNHFTNPFIIYCCLNFLDSKYKIFVCP